MRLVIIAVAAAAAAVGVAIAAPASNPALPPAPDRGTRLPANQCFRSNDIRNHTIADNKTLLLSVNRKDVYRVGVRGCLAGAVSSDPIVMRNPPGRSTICGPLDLDISIGRSGVSFPAWCMIDSVSKLSPEQIAALPRGLRP